MVNGKSFNHTNQEKDKYKKSEHKMFALLIEIYLKYYNSIFIPAKYNPPILSAKPNSG